VAPGRDLVYGRNPVAEALRGRRRVHRIWAADPGALREEPEVPVETAASEDLTRLAGSPDHQGVVAEVDPYRYADPDALLAAPEALVVALDQVQDPHNLGAICRTAEVAGAAGVVVPERRAAAVTPAVCKASAGAVEHLQVARVRNLADWLAVAKRAGAWIHGADQEAPLRYDAAEVGGRMVLVLGGEEKGLRPRVAEACDALISIPHRGRIGSLNVSAAAATLIFDAIRRRDEGAGPPPGA
jgi:23S rRNA (guanosine2251-2'-O)-methyltransferase